MGAFWPIAEAQARWIAAVLTGRCALPSQAAIDRRSGPIMRRPAFNPALYGLELREEIRRGERRRRRQGAVTTAPPLRVAPRTG
jgi:hypothetical protein